MGKVTINGQTYTGQNIFINNGEVHIDGEKVADNVPNSKSLIIHGDCKNVTTDGSVSCGTVYGNVSSGGSVSCDDVGGNVSAGGSVSCDKIGGSVTAGGSVRIS